jgi:hypothetical protein
MVNEFTIRGETLRQLRSLGNLNSTEEETLLNLISHVKCCDKWWLERDEVK